MKTKRILSAVMAVMLAVSMTACGEKGNDKNESDKKKTSADVTTTITTTNETTTTAPAEENEPVSITTTAPADKEENTTTTTTTTKSEPVQDVSLDIEGEDGYIRYPSGSGITAVATVLKYYGIDASIVDLYNIADKYVELIIRDGYTPSPWEKIVFDPQIVGSVYYAPPIVNMANKYLTSVGSNKRAKDVSGTPLEELLKYVKKGIPVIIWATKTEEPAKDGSSWIADNGKKVVCKNGMTVFVIKGYSNENIQLIYYAGGFVMEYSHDLVNEMYQSVYAQAIIIE